MKNKIQSFNLFILKYGSLLHTLFLFPILYMADISIKTPIYWAFLLNHLMFSYFLFIRGCALGIKKTIEIISHEDATKAIQDEINRNN